MTAPFIKPASNFKRLMRGRDWQNRGLVPVVPEKQKLRHKILPRTVIGISLMLLSAGIGAAFSGAAFYAYYDSRLTKNEQAVARFVEGFDEQFNDAAGTLDELRTNSVDQIRGELQPLERYVKVANGVVSLPQNIGESVWLLETRNEEGILEAGSAYAVVGHDGGTALVTSYSLIEASTREPSPGIEIVKDGKRIPAALWSWDPDRDLALITVDSNIPVLSMATNSAQVEAVGNTVFAVGGVGGQGSTASPGFLLDNSQFGLQHTAPVGSLFRGGPLVNGDGNVVGMASIEFRPYGVDPGQVNQSPDVRALCAVILRCAETSGVVDLEVGEVLVEAPEPSGEPVRSSE